MKCCALDLVPCPHTRTHSTHITHTHSQGSVVAILCDGGERYASTIYNPQWRTSKGLEEGVQAAKLRITAMVYPGGGDAAGAAGAAVLEGSKDWPCKCVLRADAAVEQ